MAQQCATVWAELVKFCDYLPNIVCAVGGTPVSQNVRALKDASANPLRIEALAFLQLALSTHPPAVFQPHAATLVPTVLSLVEDRYYKITAEALSA